jgi:hypothetical protein
VCVFVFLRLREYKEEKIHFRTIFSLYLSQCRNVDNDDNKERNNGKFVEKHVFGTMTISCKGLKKTSERQKEFIKTHVH